MEHTFIPAETTKKIGYVPFLCSPSGKGMISGHADGTIIRFMFEEDGSGLAGVS